MQDCAEKKPILLAPAGSPQALVAAVCNGTDAVYFGIDKFNARMKAENFTLENVGQWIEFCHIFGVKVCVTLNTSLKTDELKDAKSIAERLAELRVDSLIVTDPALIAFCSRLDGIGVVASTQLNLHNALGVALAEKIGADTVVLSRETPLGDIEKTRALTNVKLEAFLHGALCVCLSGQCYMSSFIDGNSGNRGLCAQPCRQPYSCADDSRKIIKKGYLLSTKDLAGVGIAKKLFEAGVDIFKIEGRNRREQYVGQAVATYRKIFDNDFKWTPKDLDELKTVFNRGDFTSGYLYNSDDIIYPHHPGHKGIEIGKIIKHGETFAINSTAFIHDGDNFKILRNNTEVGNCVALKSSSKHITAIGYSGDIREGDRVHLTNSTALNAKLAKVKRKISVAAQFVAYAGDFPRLTLTGNGCSVTLQGSVIAQKASNRPLDSAEIKILISKNSETELTISEIVVIAKNIFLPKSAVNELRRSALKALRQAMLAKYNDKYDSTRKSKNTLNFSAVESFVSQENSLICRVSSVEQYNQIKDYCDFVVFKPDDYVADEVLRFKKACNDFFLELPVFATSEDMVILLDIIRNCEITGVVANNFYALELARKQGLKLILGMGLNIFNRESALVLGSGLKVTAYIASQEISLKDIETGEMTDAHIFIEGNISMMTVVHCPAKTVFGNKCQKCEYRKIFYKDKTGRTFPVRRKKISRCYFEIENCVPLRGAGKIKRAGKYFVSYDGNIEAIKYLFGLNKGKHFDYAPEGQFTTGHLKKSVK